MGTMNLRLRRLEGHKRKVHERQKVRLGRGSYVYYGQLRTLRKIIKFGRRCHVNIPPNGDLGELGEFISVHAR